MMETITFEVSPEVAEAYQCASPEERQQLQQLISLVLKKENGSDLEFLQKNIEIYHKKRAS